MLDKTETKEKGKGASAGMGAAIAALVAQEKPLIAAGAPEGFDALLIARIAALAHKEAAAPVSLVHIARDDQRMAALREQLRFFAPNMDVLQFPAWDTVPYDRVSPHTDIAARRIATLAQLARLKTAKRPLLLITTVNAALQRVPPRDAMRTALLKLEAGMRVDMGKIAQRLEAMGLPAHGHGHGAGRIRGARRYSRPFRARGTRVPSGLDFFGDTLESIRQFDPVTQRTQAARRSKSRFCRSARCPRARGRSSISAGAMWSCSVRRKATTRSTKPSRPAAVIPAWSIGSRFSMSGWIRCSITSRTRLSQSTISAMTRSG